MAVETAAPASNGDPNELRRPRMSEALSLALIITLEPLPIVAFILVLGTDRGARNGAGYILGWVACLVVIIVGTLAITGGEPLKPASQPATVGLVITIAIGVGFLYLAWHRYRHPSLSPPKEPSWMKRLDGLKLGGAIALGVLLQPWPLVAAGAVAAAELGAENGWTALTWVLFMLIASASLLIMEGYAITKPESARAALDRLQAWIQGHRDQTITVLSLVVGVILVAQGVYGLVTAS